MPSKTPQVTEEKVKAAITALKKAGEKITNQTVRDKLGGGSFSALAPLVRKVRLEFEEAEAAANAVPEVPEDVMSAAQGIWTIAYRHAESVAAAERRDKAAAAARHENEMAEADEQLGALETTLEAAECKVADLQTALA